MLVAPVGLAVLGVIVLIAAFVLSARSMTVISSLDDPPVHCGSLVSAHHFPDAAWGGNNGGAEGVAFANHKCDGARSKRVHRVMPLGGLGLVLCIGAIGLRRRDRAIADDAPRTVEDELTTLGEPT